MEQTGVCAAKIYNPLRRMLAEGCGAVKHNFLL
jgi:hypothetical protein